MRRLIDNDVLTLAARLLVGGTFIYASIYKIIEPGDFARSIWYYHLVPGWFINPMALILPWLEFLCGLALIFGVGYRGAIVLVGIMTAVFIVALGSTIVRGLDVECGCFKVAHTATGAAWRSLILDVALALLILQLWFSRSRRWRLVPA